MAENKLNRETSPYLLQHQDNPVHWRAWGPDALAEAKGLNKPILLSVGYAACHWCHVMAHESFEDPATAAVMNDLFINIKVDREERPDIDAIYMSALHSLGQQGGWPLTMFLDTEARPFWGGTYFPKVSQYGRPPFVHVLMQVASVFHNEPEKVRNNAQAITAALTAKKTGAARGDAALSDDFIRDLVGRITAAVDPVRGGLNGAPKFPQWSIFWLLWRGSIRFDDAAAKAAVITTLTNICQGGIYDHLGGGFARYSVDDEWLVPHFEKMLYDNALLIDLLTEVWRETKNPMFAARIAETIEWIGREMIAKGGGFAASLDADSEGVEGKFYVWTAAEIADVLGADDAAFFGQHYDVTTEGNWEEVTILNRLNSQAMLSDGDEHRLAALRLKLLDRRAARIRPGWDDKVLADWNGLMIAAMTRAGTVFGREDWVALAAKAFDFVATQMSDGDRLGHSSRVGRVSAAGIASDYANMIAAALRLHQATIEPRYLDLAERWAATLDRHHLDPESGAYATAADDTRDVIIRLSNALDDATPNANALHLGNLFALGALTGKSDYQTRGEHLIASCAGDCLGNPTGHCGFLAASIDSAGVVQIVASGSDKARLVELVSGFHAFSIPGALEYVLHSNFQSCQGGGQFLPAALDGKIPSEPDVAAVYLCKGPACGNPIMEPKALEGVLQDARRKFDGVFSGGFTPL